MQRATASLQSLFQPRHVAVIGASATPGKLGHAVFRNLLQRGFAGRLSPINAQGDEVLGHAGFRHITDLTDPVDCAFLAIPASQVVAAAEACVQAGVKAMVVGASGFAETATAEGVARQARLAELAARSGCRILGPNTNGLLNVQTGLALGYNTAHGLAYAPGTITLVSHSGALFDSVARRLHAMGAGLSKFVAVGNEADITLLDVLEYLVDDPDTEIIGLILEAVTDTARWRTLALRLAAAGKRVVALKVGRSQAGASATLAHSSRLAGNSRAVQAVLRACGVATVDTVEALAGACALLSKVGQAPAAAPLFGITTSGAGGALLMDLASERGLAVAEPWPVALDTALQTLPVSARLRHPIDMGNFPDWATLDAALRQVEAHGYVGPTVAFAHTGPAPGMDLALADALAARRQRLGALTLVVSPGGLGADTEARYVAAGIPVFHDMATAFDSLAVALAVGRQSPQALAEPPLVARLAQCVQAASARAATPGDVWSERASAEYLARFGVPCVSSVAVTRLDELAEAAARVGYPVVLKAMVPGVAHKHAAGLVKVGVGSPAELQQAGQAQVASAQALGHAAPTEWLVQPWLRADLEVLAGLTHEPGLGYFLVCGLGGLQAEAFRDIVMVSLPCTEADLHQALQASFLGPVLQSLCPGGEARQRLVHILLGLQAALAQGQHMVRSIDLNPVFLTRTDAVAVDAMIVS